MTNPAVACPSPYNGLSCNPGGTNVCAAPGSNWICEAERSGAATQDATMYAVYESTGAWCTIDTYCAFGEDGYGNAFCCEIDPTTPGKTIVSVVLNGTDYTSGSGDTLDFEYSTGGVTRFLRDAVGVTLTGFQYGGDGEDHLWGSGSTSSDYDESLFGQDGADLIHGRNGGDTLYGGFGGDTCWGDNGDDMVYGESGSDTLYGGQGNDYLQGGYGDDYMNGDGNADDIYGEFDDDTYCSGADTAADLLAEDAAINSDDVLWGDAYDVEEGGGETTVPPGDACFGGGTSAVECESTLSTAPAFCL